MAFLTESVCKGTVFEIAEGRTCHVYVAAHYVQAKPPCRIHGFFQGKRPRHKPLGVNIAEVEAHDHEALEPQAGPWKGDLCDVPTDGLVGPMADGSRFARLADSNALVLLQDTTATVLQLAHLVLTGFLDGEKVVPVLLDDIGHILCALPAFQLMKGTRSVASR